MQARLVFARDAEKRFTQSGNLRFYAQKRVKFRMSSGMVSKAGLFIK